ncbi:zinc-binding protein [Methanobrevibacter sp. DSM 116169]|uniref:zinc-binding protein n=1 Tax=Methanobrevibacter sp. DSM 116169 TaxID=3242727 RepID=UPI0038FCF8B7
MAFRRCLKCGASTDDQFGFCVKCGAEFGDEKNEPLENICVNCGFRNVPNATRCVKCGAPLILNNENNIFIQIPKEDLNKKVESTSITKRQEVLIILGYIFSLLGGIIGFIIAIYLITRKNPTLKRHGALQLAILMFYIIIILLMYINGDFNNLNLNDFTFMNSSNENLSTLFGSF